MTRERMEQLEQAAERARLAGCTYTSEEIDKVDDVQHLLRLARLAPLMAAHVADHHAVYDAPNGTDMLPMFKNLARSKVALDSALSDLGLTLEQVAKEADAALSPKGAK